MHIPDGFLDTTTAVVTWAASAGSVAGLETPFQVMPQTEICPAVQAAIV